MGRSATRNEPTPLAAPFRALGTPALLVMALVAFFYNVGFFVIMSFTAMGIGLVFTGWGAGLALTTVFGAPMLTRRFERSTVLLGTLGPPTLTLVAFALLIDSPRALVAMMVVAGLERGIMNTVLTEMVMEAADLPHSVVSSRYSGIRFLGGAIAPPVAAALAAAVSMATPYLKGAACMLLAALLRFFFKRLLAHAERHEATPGEESRLEDHAVGVGDS